VLLVSKFVVCCSSVLQSCVAVVVRLVTGSVVDAKFFFCTVLQSRVAAACCSCVVQSCVAIVCCSSSCVAYFNVVGVHEFWAPCHVVLLVGW